jgi:hypothetical protein
MVACLRSAGGARALAGRLAGFGPVSALAAVTYRWIARHRHRMPGGTAACRVPPA